MARRESLDIKLREDGSLVLEKRTPWSGPLGDFFRHCQFRPWDNTTIPGDSTTAHKERHEDKYSIQRKANDGQYRVTKRNGKYIFGLVGSVRSDSNDSQRVHRYTIAEMASILFPELNLYRNPSELPQFEKIAAKAEESGYILETNTNGDHWFIGFSGTGKQKGDWPYEISDHRIKVIKPQERDNH